MAGPAYGAIDLGTNSCRLLIAVPDGKSFAVVDGYSKVVRLGDRLSETGVLHDQAQSRTIGALRECSAKLALRGVTQLRAVATEACRQASNAAAFQARVLAETGLKLDIIDAAEEAALTVSGCGDMLHSGFGHTLLFDIGGGSTEVVWVATPPDRPAQLIDMISLQFGVVSLRDEFGPECLSAERFQELLNRVDAAIRPFDERNAITRHIAGNDVRMIGTSGTVTTLGAIYLDLPRYNRTRVDGLQIGFDSIRQISARLAEMDCGSRIAHPCLGRGRGDLMLMGLAILRAVCERWPVGRLGIADRGIREGILFGLMAADGVAGVSLPIEWPTSAQRLGAG
ncbi:MAG: Ppx/GppA phosphatase family protein [Proteobacteria bacterium]|nr:Ppx/GppA phosphatase family protein [Pseudomonadota bacterium]